MSSTDSSIDSSTEIDYEYDSDPESVDSSGYPATNDESESSDESDEDESSHYSSRAHEIWDKNKYDKTPNPRTVIIEYLVDNVPDADLVEESIYHYALRLAKNRSITVDSDNYSNEFRKLYTESAYEVIMLLQHFDFRDEHVARVCEELESCSSIWDSYLFADHHYHERSGLKEIATPITIEQGFYECHRCRRAGRDHLQTVSQDIQVRSADEPTTTFVSCTLCGFNWRIN